MYARIQQQWSILMAVMMVVCLALLGACGQSPESTITPSPRPQPSPTPAELPKFLSYIAPDPGAQLIRGTLSGNIIWAIVRLEEMAPGETLGLQEAQERVEFLMDGGILDAEVERGRKPGVAEVEIGGDFDLSPGEHEATVRVRTTSGEALEYSWTFTILDVGPTVPGLPEGLQFVRPLPDSTITLQVYRQEQLVPPYHAPAFADLRGAVCAGVLTGDIVEPGEDLDGKGVSRKYSFVALDGAAPGKYAKIEERHELGKCIIVDENGAVTSYQCPHHYKCWQVELAPGQHEATIQLRNSSGQEIQYTWRFTITSD